jgi:hypothetical protein
MARARLVAEFEKVRTTIRVRAVPIAIDSPAVLKFFPGGVTFHPGEPEMTSPIRELVPSLFRR